MSTAPDSDGRVPSAAQPQQPAKKPAKKKPAQKPNGPKTPTGPKRKNYDSYGNKLHQMITKCDRRWREDKESMIARWSDDGKAFIFEENEGFKKMLKECDICQSDDFKNVLRNMNSYDFKIELCNGREGVVTRTSSHPHFSRDSTKEELKLIKRQKKKKAVEAAAEPAVTMNNTDRTDTVQQQLDELKREVKSIKQDMMNEMRKGQSEMMEMLRALCASTLGANSASSNGQLNGYREVNMEPITKGQTGLEDAQPLPVGGHPGVPGVPGVPGMEEDGAPFPQPRQMDQPSGGAGGEEVVGANYSPCQSSQPEGAEGEGACGEGVPREQTGLPGQHEEPAQPGQPVQPRQPTQPVVGAPLPIDTLNHNAPILGTHQQQPPARLTAGGDDPSSYVGNEPFEGGVEDEAVAPPACMVPGPGVQQQGWSGQPPDGGQPGQLAGHQQPEQGQPGQPNDISNAATAGSEAGWAAVAAMEPRLTAPLQVDYGYLGDDSSDEDESEVAIDKKRRVSVSDASGANSASSADHRNGGVDPRTYMGNEPVEGRDQDEAVAPPAGRVQRPGVQQPPDGGRPGELSGQQQPGQGQPVQPGDAPGDAGSFATHRRPGSRWVATPELGIPALVRAADLAEWVNMEPSTEGQHGVDNARSMHILAGAATRGIDDSTTGKKRSRSEITPDEGALDTSASRNATGEIPALTQAANAQQDAVISWLASLQFNDDNSKDNKSGVAIDETEKMSAIVQAMTANKQSERIQELACGALCNLVTSWDSFVAVLEAGGISAVVQGMTAHKKSKKVQEKACGALDILARKDCKNTSVIHEAGGIQAIVQAMAAHQQAAKVQEEACAALRNLADHCNNDNKVAVREAGGIPAIVRAMSAHRQAQEVQVQACWALHNLAIDNDNKVAVREAGGIPAIVGAMKAHPKAEKVQEAACWALLNLSAYNAANQVAVREAGGIPAVVRAMEAHPQAERLQWPACVALYHLAENEENKAVIREAGGVRQLKMAKENLARSHGVKDFADWALRQLEG